MRDRTNTLLAIAARAPVIPVVTIEDPGLAPELAATLVEAGLPVVEVTLRTPRALDAIRAIARHAPEAVVLAGTIVTPSQIGEAMDAGAAALVTPGTSPRLADALAAAPIPAMPGCATVSEAMALHERGFDLLKLFPAAASGGPAWLKGIAGPLPALRFCPTGGIDAQSAPAYLACPNVACVGGTWVTPAALVEAGDLAAIGRLARAAAGLARG
ncbi:bifunctional 4-hydroxy-2-oxoglutarate aldolase/2-dehydro-3-deoxy-phosphogluconate aldolase [Salinarimonas sp. NSM]|uniref:bifunctional 4-hydroxy-2-oxoglutarate aldolase/2-dehydro-3-deoxy-phosphogluconate aldolase n=1 Tax=Salinarimonas sp. NSM TaxID=3458003 RepID=UPI0040371CCA